MSRDKTQAFESSVPFVSHVEALCLYCSDGRFVQQTDEFVEKCLGEHAHDRLVVPGGPASLAGDMSVWREADFVGENLRFLQRAHDLKRVVLIAHDDCGFYQKKLGVSADGLERRQLDDLRKAGANIRGLAPSVEIVAFLARRSGDRVRFEPVEV